MEQSLTPEDPHSSAEADEDIERAAARGRASVRSAFARAEPSVVWSLADMS